MSVKGLSMEELARLLLEQLGFRIVRVRERIKVDDVDVAEVDIIAESPDGERYAVEVKSGKVAVGDIRQAYALSAMLGLRPMIVCRGFADRAAEITARELGVRVLTVPRLYMLEPEALLRIIRGAIREELITLLISIREATRLDDAERRALEALASASSLDELASSLGLSRDEAARLLGRLRSRIPLLREASGFAALRAAAGALSAAVELLTTAFKCDREGRGYAEDEEAARA